jgi:hypothetical protein
MSSTDPASSDPETARAYRIINWPTLPDLNPVTWSTLADGIGRRFFVYSPEIILKLGTDEGEAAMTELAHSLLGPVVPRLDAFVSIAGPPAEEGLLITRQPGQPLVELWPSLGSEQRAEVTNSLVALLFHMREPRDSLNYYGRPGRQPYITPSEFGPDEKHSFCRTRAEWDSSRTRALHLAAPDIGLGDDHVRELERIQHATGGNGSALVDTPVLTHADISDRNILVDPTSLQVTGFIDWELAIVAPAYYEYAAARLSGGHQPDWRTQLLDILLKVLRKECEREIAKRSQIFDSETTEERCAELFTETLAAWKALVDVERSAQGYSGDCLWTFDDGSGTSVLEEANTETVRDVPDT